MKRILAIVITVVMLMTMLCSVSASAVGTAEITVDVSFYDINVSVASTEGGKMTAQLVNKEENALYGMYTSRNPVEGESGYEYAFRFEMPTNAPTGQYVVYVGHNVAMTSKEFTYVRMEDKVVFYDTLDGKAAGDIKAFFNDEGAGNTEGINFKNLVPVDLAEYNALTEPVLGHVNAKLAAAEVATGITDADLYEAKKEKVETAEESFKTAFFAAMDIAEIATVTDETEWVNIAEEKIEAAILDDKFYNDEKTETIVFELKKVLPYYVVERSKVTEFEIAKYAHAFDTATLCMIASTSDYATVENAFLYYQGKGTITPDMTNINAIKNAGKSATLWKNVTENPSYADCPAFVSAVVAEAQRLVDEGILNNSSGSIGGGGSFGGGGGGGSSILKPETPGSMVTPGEAVPMTPPEAAAGAFGDVEASHWANEAIEALAEKGILNGKGDGTFAPNDGVTREEFVKIIVVAFDLSAEGEAAFADVEEDRWSAEFISAAAHLGIVNGDGTNFNPTAIISRQDMAVIIHRVFELLDAEVSGDAVSFDDSDEIADYAKKAIEALTGAGILNGMGDGTFAPNGTVTRAQAAKVVYELSDLLGGGK